MVRRFWRRAVYAVPIMTLEGWLISLAKSKGHPYAWTFFIVSSSSPPLRATCSSPSLPMRCRSEESMEHEVQAASAALEEDHSACS